MHMRIWVDSRPAGEPVFLRSVEIESQLLKSWVSHSPFSAVKNSCPYIFVSVTADNDKWIWYSSFLKPNLFIYEYNLWHIDFNMILHNRQSACPLHVIYWLPARLWDYIFTHIIRSMYHLNGHYHITYPRHDPPTRIMSYIMLKCCLKRIWFVSPAQQPKPKPKPTNNWCEFRNIWLSHYILNLPYCELIFNIIYDAVQYSAMYVEHFSE